MINLQSLTLVQAPLTNIKAVDTLVQELRDSGASKDKENMMGVVVYGDYIRPLPIPKASASILPEAPLLVILYKGKEFMTPVVKFAPPGQEVREDFTETKQARYLIQDASLMEELFSEQATAPSLYSLMIEQFITLNSKADLQPYESGLASAQLDICLRYSSSSPDEVWELPSDALDEAYPNFPTDALNSLASQLKTLLIPRIYIGSYEDAKKRMEEAVKLALFITCLQIMYVLMGQSNNITVNNTELLAVSSPISISHLLPLINTEYSAEIEAKTMAACTHTLYFTASESEVYWSNLPITPGFVAMASPTQDSIVTSVDLINSEVIRAGLPNESIKATVVSQCGEILNEIGYYNLAQV